VKRNCRFEVRFTKDELSDLTKKARKAHITNAAFVRHTIQGAEVREAPNADVGMLIRDVRRVGNSINQLLLRANTQGFIDAPLLREALEENHRVAKTILDAYTTRP